MPRRLDAAWAVALATGAAGALLLPRPVSLADPPACAGLLELAGIVASRTVRDVPLGEMIVWANRLIVAAALVLFVRLLQKVANDLATWLAAVAAAIALLLTSPFESVLAPTNAAAFAAACLAWNGAAGLQTSRVVIALALLAGIAPTLMIPCIIAVIPLLMARSGQPRNMLFIVAAIAAVVAGPAIVSIAVPPLPAVGVRTMNALDCAQPPVVVDFAGVRDGLRLAIGPVTSFAIALAALGAFSHRGGWRRLSTRWSVIFATLPFVAAALGAPDPARTFAPVVAALWILAALGLREVVLAIAPRGPRWIAVALVLASLPWLQQSTRPDRTPIDADRLRGHEALSRQRFLQVLSAIPPGGGLVVEDAVVSMLATDAGRRRAQGGRPLVFVPPSRDQIARTLPKSAVFALPRRQSTLRHLGFQLTDLGPRANGVAEVRAGAPCAIAEHTWHDATVLTTAAGFALVADDEPARGPVSILFGSTDALSPERSWPRRAERGFTWSQIDRARDGGQARIDGFLSGIGVPPGQAVATSPFVTSVDVWRVPGGPLILPVTLHATPSAALIRRRDDAVPGRVWICPSAPFEVKPLFDQ